MSYQRYVHQCIGIIIFSVYANSQPLIWATYHVFQKEITEAYCINKTDAACQGKCYITNVQDDTESEKKNEAKPDVRLPELSECVVYMDIDALALRSSRIGFESVRPHARLTGFLTPVFRPPQA
jgi:hypothetical protein